MIKIKLKSNLVSSLLSTIIIITITNNISADDTEVFTTSSSTINPNVLFIMDNSSSMKKLIDGKSRIQIMKDALSSVLDSADDYLNVGITNYGNVQTWRNDYANGIKFPIKPLNTLVKPIIEESLKDRAGNIQWRHHRQPAPAGNGQGTWFNPVINDFDSTTVRQYLPEVANTWSADGNTPIVDALYEAALYFRGGAIKYQDTSGYGGRGHYKASAHPSTYRYPEGDFYQSAAFPEIDFPFVPQWYADNLSSEWSARSVNENSWYFENSKLKSLEWHTSWIRCPSNSGWPNYNPIKNSGESTRQHCRTMRDDFVKYLQQQFGSRFNTAVNTINMGYGNSGNSYVRRVDNAVKTAIRQVSISELRSKASLERVKNGRKIFHFNQFPRCRVIQEVVCEDGTESDWSATKAKYKCDTTSSESCRSWNYEQCENPADTKVLNEVICDFDQNVSRYPSPNYTSPIVGDCQSNYIVLMSDGKPEYSNGDRKSYKASISSWHSNVPELIGKSCVDDPYFKAGTCGPDLTKFLAMTDNMPQDTVAPGKQTVQTMVIGFSESVSDEPGATEYLKSLVTIPDNPETDEKDGYFNATDQASLVEAFTKALNEIAVVARSQASPGYSVNIKSGLEHEDEVYIPVFDRDNSSAWSGNLKKFKLVPVGESRHIRGKTPDVDAMTELGLFKPEAWDLWSTSATADGNSVEKGGVASLLTEPSKRKLYSDITTNKNLWVGNNRIHHSNNKIKNYMVGEPGTVKSKAYRKKLLKFVRGWQHGNKNKPARKHMGDMLHSEPVVITYKSADEDGNGKKQYIFVATNEGYLHAFDTETGEEKFAFMPKQLLKNIQRQFVGTGKHIYGIDGGISYVKTGENVYLYFGLRRGGKAYYALDVTDIDKPKLMWKIDGETDTNNFPKLGQSWSMPYIANVMHGGVKKTAIVFTGGNDEKLDYGSGSTYSESDVVNPLTADTGNDIYIVNAKTGSLLWSLRGTMQRNDVEHAIPGGARILDVNNNGLLDRIYFADTGGNVWRLDLHENLSDPLKSKIVKIASLGGADSERRKFYNEPDVAQLTDNGNLIYTVSIGSGLRPHPINKKINDHMFMLLEKSPLKELVESGDGKYETIEMNDLANVKIEASVAEATSPTESPKVTKTLTHTGFTKDSDNVQKITQTDKRGWYVKFPDSGEKVLAPSITFEGSIFFTTLVPSAITSGELISACASPGTQGRLYGMNILTGEAGIDIEGDTDVDDNDVFDVISANEIPGKPQRIFNNLNCSGGSCTHDVDIRIGKKNSEVGTEDVSEVESIYWNDPK